MATWNNPPSFADGIRMLEQWHDKHANIQYICGQPEAGEKCGTPHLQFFIFMKTSVRTSNVVKLFPGSDITMCTRGSLQQCMEYPTDQDKESKGKGAVLGEAFHFGKRPQTQADKGKSGPAAKALMWEGYRTIAYKGPDANGEWPGIPVYIQMMQHQMLMRCFHNHNQAKRDMSTIQGDLQQAHIWLWGEAGSGKSRMLRERFPGAHLKACNKWWDGYRAQEEVLIEDIDTSHSCLGHHLKIWADRYPFPGEYKGGCTQLRPRRILVSSNFHPREIWPDSQSMLEPIERRFNILKITKGTSVPQFLVPLPVIVAPDPEDTITIEIESESEEDEAGPAPASRAVHYLSESSESDPGCAGWIGTTMSANKKGKQPRKRSSIEESSSDEE